MLRNAVYTISFPKSSTKEDFSVIKILRHVSLITKSKTYQEVDLASLMEEFGIQYTGSHEANNMRRIMRGSPVTTRSKPDLAPLDSRESKLQIRFGEFKNNKEYDQSTARTQCVMYLLGLLYWLRTELGEPVEAVYGFYFCGCRCKNEDNTYSVGLIKLSAPKWLGEELKAETF
jgi:hypothetical protein